jgi:LPXTG-motif cell wall-anchored protein
VLLAIEVVADKVPVVDHVNDVAQTVVRPTAGGLAFGAGSSSETVTVTDPGAFFSSHQWVPIAAGVVIALVVHGVKAAARPVVNASTAGVGAPVASTAEDFSSVVLSVVAIVLPLLVLIGIVLLIVAAVVIFRRRREKRRTGGVPTGRLFG